MPIFEYECKQCGHVTAFLEKAGARGKHTCEECNSTQTEKVFSTFAARVASPAAAQRGCPNASACGSATCPMAG